MKSSVKFIAVCFTVFVPFFLWVGLFRVLAAPSSLERNIAGAVIAVDTTVDDLIINGNCTLREAVRAANTNESVDACPAGSGADTILVPPGVYTLTVVISNTDGGEFPTTHHLEITSTLTISGTGPENTIIDANAFGRAFWIHPVGPGGVDVILSGLTIQNGTHVDGGVGIRNDNNSTLTVTNCIFRKNIGDWYWGGPGGGIANLGKLTVLNSQFIDNVGYRVAGAIYNEGFMTVTGSIFTGNSSRSFGGAILNLGSATIQESKFISNTTVENGGGAIYSESSPITMTRSTFMGNKGTYGGAIQLEGGSAVILNSTISNNSPLNFEILYGWGGGIYVDAGASLTIDGSTISNNTVYGDGGGIYIFGSSNLTITNSTLSGNIAQSNGGGLYNAAVTTTATLENVTVAANKAGTNSTVKGNGGGIYWSGGSLFIHNSLIADNSAVYAPSGSTHHNDCSINPGMLISRGYNLVGRSNGCNWTAAAGDHLGTNGNPINPKLGPLGSNGGPTFTHALLAGSPAVNAGDPAHRPAVDQRGFPRSDGACDIGAYELQHYKIFLPVIFKNFVLPIFY